MAAKKKTPRERAPNFTIEEVHKLVSLVRQHHDIIECKLNDGTTWREKDAEWNKVTAEFNATSLIVRSQASLRIKYDLLKKEARKKSYQDQLKSGGVTYNPPKPDDVLDKIEKLFPLSIYGPASTADNNYVHHGDLGEHAMLGKGDNNLIKIEAEDEDYKRGPGLSHQERTHIQALLYQPCEDLDESTCGEYEVSEASPLTTNPEPHEYTASAPSTCTVVYPVASTSANEEGNAWDTYTPAMMPQPKHASLVRPATDLLRRKVYVDSWRSRRRGPTLQEKQANNVSANNFLSIASLKKELADLKRKLLADEQHANQLPVLLNDLDVKIKKSQLVNSDLDIKIKEAKLKSLDLDVKIKEAQLDSLKLDVKLKEDNLLKLQSNEIPK